MTISQAAKFLEDAFDALNKEYFESTLSKPIITIQSSPKTYGHFITQEAWKDTQRKKSYYEINISAEGLNRPISNIIATLVHEMVHCYCTVNDIQDTSRDGTYHNKRFKEESEKRGLLIDYDAKIGHFITQPAPVLKTFCTAQHWRSKLTISRMGTVGDDRDPKPKKPGSTRKYVCPYCGQSIRATKGVNIMCMDCNQQMKTHPANEKTAPRIVLGRFFALFLQASVTEKAEMRRLPASAPGIFPPCLPCAPTPSYKKECNTMKKEPSYRRITWTDRLKIEALYNAGYSFRFIAKELDFAHSAIHYEVQHGLYDHLESEPYLYVKKYSATM